MALAIEIVGEDLGILVDGCDPAPPTGPDAGERGVLTQTSRGRNAWEWKLQRSMSA
ncbi:MAG: hypothetical protein R2851_07250 [Caldilineaceae bacterium]